MAKKAKKPARKTAKAKKAVRPKRIKPVSRKKAVKRKAPPARKYVYRKPVKASRKAKPLPKGLWVGLAVVIIAVIAVMFLVSSGQVTFLKDAGTSETGETSPILGECQSQCEGYGYLEGVCVWPTEAEMPGLELWNCTISGSRHCGNEGQCKCFCQKLKEEYMPVIIEPDAEPETSEPAKDTCNGMGLEDAKAAAESTECLENATFKDTYMCNSDTSTWWIDLDLVKEGCNPACVIHTDTGEAEINWRCTG
ncbi:MAG: hypothetical protein V3V26_02210, partial [Candidatus Aenigmarchaeota archaeon]